MGKLRYLLSRFKFYVKKILKKQDYIFNSKIQDLVFTLSENGFVVIPNFYTEEECNFMKNEIDLLILKRENDNRVWKDRYSSDYRCFGAEDDSEEISAYFNNQFLNSVADNYFKTKMSCCNTLAARIKYVDGNVGSGQGWHRDSNQMQFKAMVYITDVENKDGPFQLISGSHKLKNILNSINIINYDGLNTRFESCKIEKLISLQPENYNLFLGKAGTLILFDSSTIHTGSPLSYGGERYALTNYYMPSYENVKAQRNVFINAHIK